MPAPEKSSVSISRIGVIAGGGALPQKLLSACESKNIEPFVIGFEGQTDPLTVQGRNHLWTRLGAAGQVIATLRKHNIKDLVMIGSIRRPGLMEIKPDLKGAEILAKIGLKALGDNGLLGALRAELEREGFRLHGVQEFIDDLLVREGGFGKNKPKKEDWIDIRYGVAVSQALGAFDIGQSVIVQQGMVLGVEGAEGTDDLIQRCKYLQRAGRGAVLVKTCKPQQDRDLDLPTIGPETVRAAIEAGFCGIAVQAGATLIIDADVVAETADRHKIFVIGMKLPLDQP